MTTLLSADDVRAATPWRELIGAIGAIVTADDARSPDRHVHDLELPDGESGALLLMPSWITGDAIGVKTVTYVPTNAGTGVPTVNAAYLLFDGGDGRLRAVLDGDELTARRTAAISALAADRLSRRDAHRVLIVGTGHLSTRFAEVYRAIRDIEHIDVWGRNAATAAAVAEGLARSGHPAHPSTDLAASVRAADIVACVTGATTPLVHGDDLRPGTHLDLVGGFREDMRETDDVAVRRARIYVDTFAGALVAGDLAQPLAAGVISPASIRGDLRSLVDGSAPGRSSDDEITLFKSAGFALADLAAARLAWARRRSTGIGH